MTIEPSSRPGADVARMDVPALQALLSDVFATWVQELGLVVRTAADDGVVLDLPVHPRHVHAGGVMCGQTLMAAADTALVLAISHRLGGFRPMTTVQLQTTFLRPIAADAGEARVLASVLRLGRNLAFGEVRISSGADVLAAQATTTYALL